MLKMTDMELIKSLVIGKEKLKSDSNTLVIKNTAEGLKARLTRLEGNKLSQETRKGYNLIPYPYVDTTKEENGIEYTDLGDGTIKVNGTATEDSTFKLCQGMTFDTSTTYCMSGCPSGGNISTYSWVISAVMRDTGTAVTFVGKSGLRDISIEIKQGTVCDNLIFKPMITIGTDTSKPYEQYGAMPSIDYPSKIEGIEKEIEVKIQNKNIAKTYQLNKTSDSGLDFSIKDNIVTLNGITSRSGNVYPFDSGYINLGDFKKGTYYFTIKYIDGTYEQPSGVQNAIYLRKGSRFNMANRYSSIG